MNEVFSLNSHVWLQHFLSNLDHMEHIPWEAKDTLSDAERDAIGKSIATFQLGENAEGNSFKRAGQQYVARTGDRHYMSALRQFIAEEQRHSLVLGRQP